MRTKSFSDGQRKEASMKSFEKNSNAIVFGASGGIGSAILETLNGTKHFKKVFSFAHWFRGCQSICIHGLEQSIPRRPVPVRERKSASPGVDTPVSPVTLRATVTNYAHSTFCLHWITWVFAPG